VFSATKTVTRSYYSLRSPAVGLINCPYLNKSGHCGMALAAPGASSYAVTVGPERPLEY